MGLLRLLALSAALQLSPAAAEVEITGAIERFAPGIATTGFAEIRLTISPDGRTALWFSRDRPDGAGGYDIWMSRRTAEGWGAATPVSFNTAGRDFDPAFSPDGRFVYFCSDREGGLGGDDLYRVAVTADGFGRPETLGPNVNSAGNEWAPMLSPDRTRLLFSSDRGGPEHRQDLFVARRQGVGFAGAQPVAGAVNTVADEFDATFLADSRTIVFSRAANLRTDRIDLFATRPVHGLYEVGTRLPPPVNGATDSYAPMLDWSRTARFSFSADRDGAGVDLYTISYRIAGRREAAR